MLISEFAKATGLSVDTVRFYVRKGLLTPHLGSKGGRHPYCQFGPREVRVATAIRIGRAFGLSLQEIRLLLTDVRPAPDSHERGVRLMKAYRVRLQARLTELEQLMLHLDAKIAWMAKGGIKPPWPTRTR